MASEVINARSATLIVNSPLRHASGALAVSAGFAYVLEAEDQFHRSIWFGVVFAGLTGAWFILGSFLALIDTTAVWWTALLLAVVALGLWVVGRTTIAPGEVDDVGRLDEPLTVLRVALAVLVGSSAVITLSLRRRRWPGWMIRHSAATGALVLLAGLAATTGAAATQAFSPTGDCGPLAERSGSALSAPAADTSEADQTVTPCS